MASLSFAHLFSLPRCHSDWPLCYTSCKLVQLQGLRLQNKKWAFAARKKIAENLDSETPDGDEVVVKKKTTRTSKRTRKKPITETPEENSELEVTSDGESVNNVVSASSKDTKKSPRKTRKKASSATSSSEDVITEKKVRRRRKIKQKDDSDNDDLVSDSEMSESEESTFIANVEDESEEELKIDEGEDISFTYGWPPLVCCFGAAQHAFVPAGRPANRLIDYEVHERMNQAFWAPEKFVRAPGGSAGSVAIALASLGGKVAFMGKLGSDDYGEAMLCYMNANNVQTRSVCIDSKRPTAISHMKISKRGRLRMTNVKPCAEDFLSKTEINIDVLKEAKMFYVSTHSLLDPNMRSTTLQAIKISKKLGGVIFYDVNLPLPLWHSSEEAKNFIQQVWNLADIIEVTKQELEFLCEITPLEEFDTKNNAKSKFAHYKPEVVAPLWHENLKVLFVTNGTSKIHYYTAEHNGAINGMEDPLLTPFTGDMSASGDGIVAAFLRMLSVQPDRITDKGYLERTIRYAIDCGVIDQWALGRVRGFPPKEGMEEEVVPDENGIRSITEMEYRTVVESVS
ncbi:fructokinase-like 2, chloroplastic [Cannabis sativa]|uniref:Carbohydrate kinase PfkB domain-containing protein n=1 Tax=Cannabis sativa TaxID=3483 RepID=A0A803NUJ8_CANSA|nr:fructokinase-like 2, chloroplastic [Cannabis sativa]